MIKPVMPLKGLEIWACEWEDAYWDSAEMERSEIAHRPILYISYGLLLKHDETGITLATDVSQTGTFRGFNFIPAKMITRCWKVGLADQRIQRKSMKKARQSSVDTPASVGE